MRTGTLDRPPTALTMPQLNRDSFRMRVVVAGLLGALIAAPCSVRAQNPAAFVGQDTLRAACKWAKSKPAESAKPLRAMLLKFCALPLPIVDPARWKTVQVPGSDVVTLAAREIDPDSAIVRKTVNDKTELGFAGAVVSPNQAAD